MNKICTDIPQSKKLIDLGIDVNIADMYYQRVLPKSDMIEHNPKIGNPIESLKYYNMGYANFGREHLKLEEHCIPAWSLSALLELIPERIPGTKLVIKWDGSYYIEGRDCLFDNAVDAAFEMVCWLKENNKI